MSINFNQTSSPYKGLVQLYELELGFNRADVSGSSEKLAQFTTDCNIAVDDFTRIAIESSGKWQYDDSNHTDYPIIKTSLTTGQRDYPITTDENSNLVLDIHKVFVLPSSTATLYEEISPIDQQSESGAYDITAENTAQGTPYQYDKTANSIILDPPPSYTVSSGLKVIISREGSYFTTSDTTKKPGVPGIFHKYFYLKPAREYARRNSLASFNRLDAEIIRYEGDEDRGIVGLIGRYYGNRARDERNIMKGKIIKHR